MSELLEKAARGARPPPAPGFAHVQRFWEPDTDRWTVKLLPGEYYVTPHDEAVTTVLGSCISACVRDPMRQIGGMNHFMLPEDSASGHNSWLAPGVGLSTRYGTYAMESLINGLLILGAARQRLEIKLFGGSRVLASMTDVGARNIAFIRDYLELEGLSISAEDLGGTQPRKVIYFPATGRVRVRKLRPIETRAIGDRERIYMESIGKTDAGGDVELFDREPP